MTDQKVKDNEPIFLQEKSILICTNYSEIIVICFLAESLSKRKNQTRYAYVGNWFCHFTL